jgi:hypothetical protein
MDTLRRDGIDACWSRLENEKTAKYRYDVSDVGDWYAEVDDQDPDSGHAWFELELGIMVEQERVPLLPCWCS